MLRATRNEPSGRRLETEEDNDDDDVDIEPTPPPPPPTDNASTTNAAADDADCSENVESASSKPPLSEEEKELKRQKAAEKKEKKKKKEKKEKKKKSEAKKTKKRESGSIAATNHQGNTLSSEPSESTSNVEESEATTTSKNRMLEEISESETGIQETHQVTKQKKSKSKATGPAAALPIDAEPTEPARANAASTSSRSRLSSNDANWIDRKTRPGNSGEPLPSGRSKEEEDVGSSRSSSSNRIPVAFAVAAADIISDPSNSSSLGDNPWTPSNRPPGQPRTVLASSSPNKVDSDDKTKNMIKSVDDDVDDLDVEQGGHNGTQEECIKEIFEKDIDQHEEQGDIDSTRRGQDVPVAGTQPGAVNIRGMNHRPSLQQSNTVMSTNTSARGNSTNDIDGTAPLVAHLVEEPSDSNIVVAVEHDDSDDAKHRYDPRRLRRQRLILAAFIVVFLVLALVVGLALGMTQARKKQPDLFYQVVPPIDGDSKDGDFGSSVSMCSDGSRVAIGAQGNGEVKVYELLLDGESGGGGERKQIGQTLRHNVDNMMTTFIRSRVVVELASNCQVLAIGCPFSNVDNKTMVGEVWLYEYNSASDSWEPLGNPNVIPGEDDSDFSGASLSLSQTGDHIAIGSPGNDWAAEDCGRVRLFLIDKDKWKILGEPLNGTFPGEGFGGSVSLANEQTFNTYMLAVGSSSRSTIREAYGTNDPDSEVAVRVFNLKTGSWQQRGKGIVPQVFNADTKWFVKLSSDGLKLVVSNLYLEPDGIGINEDNDGIYVAAFELDDSQETWVPRGDSIHRNFPGKKSGYIISLSENGERIGMGDPGKEGPGGLSGHAHFYEFNGDQWCQLGPDIVGEAAGDMAGYSVSLSGDGKRMVISSPKSRALGSEHGRVMVVELHEDRIVPKCEGISLHQSRR